MASEPQLNVLILATDLDSRLRESIQAQVQGALRQLPRWALSGLARRMAGQDTAAGSLIVEPQHARAEPPRSVSFGTIDGRPVVRLLPLVRDGSVTWPQDRRYLVAKAVAYLLAPAGDEDFWRTWRGALSADRLREVASAAEPAWTRETDLGLFIELLAAYTVNPEHTRWEQFPNVRAVLEGFS